MDTITLTEQERAIEKLKELLKDVDTIYTTMTHISQSGMLRAIIPMIAYIEPLEEEWSKSENGVSHKLPTKKPNKPIIEDLTYWASKALGWKTHDKGGIKVTGTGMDMGFHLVYSLCSILYEGERSGYTKSHRWL